MKKIRWQAWLLMFWPYAALCALLAMTQLPTQLVPWCFGLWSVATVAVCVLNIISAVKKRDDAAHQELVLKLAHIPYYAAVLILSILLFAAPPLVILFLMMDALFLLSTSFYGICAVIRIRRDGRLSACEALLLLIGHLIFVLDIPSALILYLVCKRK